MALIETDFGATPHSASPGEEPRAQKSDTLTMLTYAMGRSRVLIASLATLGVLLGFVYGAIRLNVFEATGKLLLRVGVREGSTAETGITQDTMVAYARGKEAMFTELELLATPDLYQTVVDKVGAARIVQFRDPSSFDDETTSSLTRALHRFQSWWFRDTKDLDPNEVDIEGMASLAVEQGLFVEAAGFSSVISVSYQGQDKELAKEIVDAYMRAAEEYHREIFSTRAQLTFQESRLAEARKRSKAAEKRLADFQRKQRIFDLDYQKKDLLKAVAELQKKIDESGDLMERYRQRKNYLLSIIEGKDENRRKMLAKIPNPEIERLERELANWKRTKLTTGTGLEKDRFKLEEQMRLINGEIARIEKKLKATSPFLSSEINLTSFLDQQYEIESGLITYENVLKKQTARMKSMLTRLQQLQAAEVELDSLREAARQAKAEADSAADQVERLSLIGLLDEKKMGNLRVLQEARVSREKVAPKRAKFLVFGLILGFGIGLILAFGRVLIDPFVRRPAEVQSLTSGPTLAVVREGALQRSKGHPLSLFGEDKSTDLEVVEDNCWYPLSYGQVQGEKQRVAIMGDDDLVEHGLVAAATAVGLAKWTRKPVVLIETDFRKPRVAQSLGVDPNQGLSDILDGTSSIEQGLQQTPLENLWVLPAGNGTHPQPGWRATPVAQDLMKRVNQQFQYVVMDLAPLGSDAETYHFLADADTAMIVTRAGQSKKSSLRKLTEALAQARVPLIGTVLSGYKGIKLFWFWGSDPSLKGIPS